MLRTFATLRPAFAAIAFSLTPVVSGDASETSRPPNVVLILTDDQGYGDVAAHGNPVIKTPNMDRLHGESVRLTDYHVDPTCSPTRSALMTGRYSTRTGVWHTILGRSMMSPDELTMAEVFAANGYRTGIFGKWHLGDNYPLRPQDQGFEHCIVHGGGGVGQTPDYWDNDYFDDTYWVNGKPTPFEGYCTDVFFSEATRFIESSKDKPFFCYIPTNAPHGPYLVDEKYSRPYLEAGMNPNTAKFYGMITNIDENLGKLREKLAELGLAGNTIFIFTTDNGTSAGHFDAGMRGKKGSEYDGGHRVPFFIHWPEGNLKGGRDVDYPCAHIDVLPTLVDLCELEKPEGPKIDGSSLSFPLTGLQGFIERQPDVRTLFVHSQRIQHPEKWRKSAVMRERWRLINGKELYDIKADPGQKKDIASDNPEVVKWLRGEYDKWWESLTPAFDDYVRIGLGGDENPARLTCHDWHCEDSNDCPWHQNAIKNGKIGNGPWAVEVLKPGPYEITLTRWADHLGREMGCTAAKLELGDVNVSEELKPADDKATFRVELPASPAMLKTRLTREDGKEHGAYYAYVRFAGDTEEPADDVAGVWEGTLGVGGVELRLAFHLKRDDDGKLTATMDSIDQGGKGIPVQSAEVKDGELILKLPNLAAEYTGKLSDDGKSIEGFLKQSGGKYKLDLKRVEKVTVLNRPQTPKPPFPYDAEDVTFPSKADGVELAGTLTVPKGDGPFPAAILISGSGPQDRDETLFGHKTFGVLADHLTRNGIAVLRYDDRGVGKSTGSQADATSGDFAEDVEGGMEFLKKRDKIDPAGIGLIGHSEGGLIAPMIAARRDDVAFVVMLAGPGFRGDEIIYQQSELIAKTAGADEEALAWQDRLLGELVRVGTGDGDVGTKKAELKKVIEKSWAELPEEDKKEFGDEIPGHISRLPAMFASPWFGFFLKFDPREALKKTKCPVLAVIGENDLQVPAKENLEAIRKALKEGGNERIRVEELPKLNHLFQTSETGLPSEYGKIEESFSPKALELISGWIKEIQK